MADFQVENVDGVQVSLHGLGPLNFPVRRMIRYFLRRHLRGHLQVHKAKADGRAGRDSLEREDLYQELRILLRG